MEDQNQLARRIWERFGTSLYRFCLLQMKNQADAEDVMQEVLCKRLWQAPAFQSEEHERRWLFRVALNQCRSEWRRSSRRELPLEAAATQNGLEPDQLELLEQVAALPEKQRTAIHLHYYEGYSVDEIAHILGVTVSAVKMRLKRGREALRVELEGEV